MRGFRLIASAAAGIALSALGGDVAASADSAHTASTVPLVVFRARDGEAAALAKVIIHGRAFPFLIDTGASVSVVDLALARRLALRRIGKPVNVSGVGCTSAAYRVRLSNWRIGNQTLPAIIATSTKITGANGRAFGLLGSDVLSRFGLIGIDYTHATLTLG